MNHALKGKIHGLWSVARVKKHALEATVTMETVASRASGPVKEVQGLMANCAPKFLQTQHHWSLGAPPGSASE